MDDNTPNTTEEQDQAHDVGQAHSNELFNRVSKQEQEVGSEAGSAPKAPGTHVDAHGDVVQDNPNADAQEVKDQETAGGADSSFYRREDNSSKKGRGFGLGRLALAGKVRGFGPSGGVFATILFAIVSLAGGSIGLFGNLLINMKELFLNDQANHSRVNHIYSNAMFASKMTKGKCTGKVPILCRFQTMSNRQIAKLERAGFKVDVTESKVLGLRNKVGSITYPDGQVANSGREFHQIANSSVENARAVRLATNGRVAFYLNSKMFDIYDRYGINKLKKLTGKNKNQFDSEVDRNTNGSDKEGGTDEERRKAAEDKAAEDAKNATNEQYRQFTSEVQKTAGKAGNIAIVVSAVCGVYNLSHKALAYAKEYHIDEMVKYASLFMTEADATKDLGDQTPEASEYIGDTLNSYQTNPTNDDGTPNEEYNKTATDSIGYKTAALGDGSPTPNYAKQFRAGGYSAQEGKGWLDKVSQYISDFERAASYLRPENAIHLSSTPVILFDLGKAIASNLGNPMAALKSYAQGLGDRTNVDDGREAIRYYCQQAGPLAVISFLVVCGVAILGLFTVIATAPSAGTLAMCAVGAACLAPGPTKAECTDVMKKMLQYGKEVSDKVGATDYVLSLLQSSSVGSFLKGVLSGEAWASGYSFFSSAVSSGYGLRPATTPGEAQKFVASTQGDPDVQQDEKLAYLDARSTPLDISNRHSLLGSVVWNLQPYYDKNSPVFSGLASVFSAIPNAIKSQDPTASAYYSQPVSTPTGRYDCQDPDLQSIGIKKTDRFCNTVGIMTDPELEAARKQSDDQGDLIEKNVDYMTHSQPKNEGGGGTLDDSFCDINPLASCHEDNKRNSTQPSVDENGKTIPDSQYSKYIKYCTEQRKAPWGMYTESVQEATSTRDLKWFTGQQCLSDSNMMIQFRTFYNMCSQSATMDDTQNCWSDETEQKPSSTCAGGGNQAIYTCALKYDDYGYKWGGGHGDVPNAQQWIADFNAGKVPKWTHILDCSGLVRMAYVEAMGVEDQAYVAPGGYSSSANWDKIDPKSAQQGDIVTEDGHVAIVEAPYNPSTGKIAIFEAATEYGPIEDNIRHSQVDIGSVLGAYRGKKPDVRT